MKMRKLTEAWRLKLPAVCKSFFFDEIDSTNTFLKEYADSGGEHLTIAVTKTQSAGRGRGDRAWVSPEGNVFWSILLRPDGNWPPLTSLPLVLALSIKRILDQIAGGEARTKIKWPNDVLLDGKKVSGMLLETSARAQHSHGHAIEWCVAGIGININQHPIGNVSYSATDLISSGVEDVARDQIIEALTGEVIDMLSSWSKSGFLVFKDEVERSLAFLGEEIDVAVGIDRNVRQIGTLVGLTDEGFARLVTAEGERTLSAGEVFGI